MTRAPVAAAVKTSRLPTTVSSGPAVVLYLREAMTLIVGVVIGAGIFKAPSMVAAMTGSTAWMFGGLISLIGALCYAELATSCPDAGGDYHFLKRAYGKSVSFLFGWARFSVITTGSIALLAFVFGDYMNQVLPLGAAGATWGPPLYAVAAIAVLSWVNLRDIRSGSSAQTWLTGMEVAGLLLIGWAALFLAYGGEVSLPQAAAVPQAAQEALEPGMFGLATVFVLLTYGGWNEAAYISAEMKDERRNIVLALVLSIFIITALYLMVTWAYWKGLGLQGMAQSKALAADLLQTAFGPVGETIISVFVAIAALTSIDATMIVGARSSYALGRDWPLLEKLALWDARRGTPVNAMRLQGLAALLLMLLGAWTGQGFKSMIEFTAPVFWFFFLLSGVALFVLRVREPRIDRPFKVPLFPLLPLIFCATCAYMLWASLSYVYSQSLGGLNAAWIGVAVLAAGALLLLLLNRTAPAKFPANRQPFSNPSTRWNL